MIHILIPWWYSEFRFSYNTNLSSVKDIISDGSMMDRCGICAICRFFLGTAAAAFLPRSQLQRLYISGRHQETVVDGRLLKNGRKNKEKNDKTNNEIIEIMGKNGMKKKKEWEITSLRESIRNRNSLSSRMKRCPVFSGVLGHRRWWFPDRGTKGTIVKFHSNKHWLKIVLWKAKGGSSHQMDRCLNMFEQGKARFERWRWWTCTRAESSEETWQNSCAVQSMAWLGERRRAGAAMASHG